MGASLALVSGCTSRGMTVTSQPPGAEVSINRRVVGKTPIRVGFTHYGTYRIELRKEKFQTLVKEEPINPGYYGYDPAAFVADNLVPARLNDEVYLHYVMAASQDKSERVTLLDRAEGARAGNIIHPKTGEELHVALGRPAPRDAAPAADPDAETPAVAEARTPAVETGAEAARPEAQKPEGLRLAKEYGITPESSEKRGTFVKPEDEKKPGASRVVRIPKDEELIYDESAPSEAEKKAAPRK